MPSPRMTGAWLAVLSLAILVIFVRQSVVQPGNISTSGRTSGCGGAVVSDAFPRGQVQPLLRYALIDTLGLHNLRNDFVKAIYNPVALKRPAHVVLVGLGETDSFMTDASLQSQLYNVTAFEPLKSMIALWNKKPHVMTAAKNAMFRVFNCGVGSGFAKDKLAHYGGNGQDFISYEPLSHRMHDTDIDFISIDTQGHELETLQGAEELLAAGRIKVMMIEACYPDTNKADLLKMVQLIDKHDYVMFDTTWHRHSYGGSQNNLWSFTPLAGHEDIGFAFPTDLAGWANTFEQGFQSVDILQVDLICIHRSHFTSNMLKMLTNMPALGRDANREPSEDPKMDGFPLRDSLATRLWKEENAREHRMYGWRGLPASLKLGRGQFLWSPNNVWRLALSDKGAINVGTVDGSKTGTVASGIIGVDHLTLTHSCELQAVAVGRAPNQLFASDFKRGVKKTCVVSLGDDGTLCAYSVHNTGNVNHGTRSKWVAAWCHNVSLS